MYRSAILIAQCPLHEHSRKSMEMKLSRNIGSYNMEMDALRTWELSEDNTPNCRGTIR